MIQNLRSLDSNPWSAVHTCSAFDQSIFHIFSRRHISVTSFVKFLPLWWNSFANFDLFYLALDKILKSHFSGQSYKHFTTLESYWLENCLYFDSRVIIYEHKCFIGLTPGNFYSAGSFSMLQMASYWRNNLAFWSHCSQVIQSKHNFSLQSFNEIKKGRRSNRLKRNFERQRRRRKIRSRLKFIYIDMELFSRRRSVRPDWAIFESFGLQILLQKLPKSLVTFWSCL